MGGLCYVAAGTGHLGEIMSASGRNVYTALFHPPDGKARIVGVFSTRKAANDWLFEHIGSDDAKYHTVENFRVNMPHTTPSFERTAHAYS